MLNIDTNTYDTLKAFGAFANKFGSDSTTVARLGIGESGHVVNTTKADKAYAFTRTAEQKRLNNETRTEFRDAVASLFGGDKNIPRSVKKAMLLGDYGKGKPLTARRIAEVAVTIANAINKKGGLQVDGREVAMPDLMNDIGAAAVKGGTKFAGGLGLLPDDAADIIENGLKTDPVKNNGVAVMTKASESKTAAAQQKIKVPKDMRPIEIYEKTAQKMTTASEDLLNVELSDEDHQRCADLLAKYGNGLPKKTVRLLSNYIVNSIACKMDDLKEHGNLFNNVPFEERLKDLVDDMKEWTEFKFGDPRFKEIGQKLAQRQNAYIQEVINKPNKFSEKHKDVFDAMSGDSTRGTWKSGGKKFKRGSSTPEQVVNKFLKTVKDPLARKAVSIVLNQSSLADLQSVLTKNWNGLNSHLNKVEPEDEDAPALPGGELFVSHSPQKDGCHITVDFDVSYELQMSKDGKTAFVTVALNRDISCWSAKDDDSKVGTATIAQRTTLDLTQKPLPVVTDVTFSQTFSPDEIRLTSDQ